MSIDYIFLIDVTRALLFGASIIVFGNSQVVPDGAHSRTVRFSFRCVASFLGGSHVSQNHCPTSYADMRFHKAREGF